MIQSPRVGPWRSAAAATLTLSCWLAAAPAPAAESSSASAESAATPAATPAAAAPAAGGAQAAAPLFPFTHGKVADGATKTALCTGCHGPNGNSLSPDWPRLAGQSAVYIDEQLHLFRAGVRNNPVMMPLAATLSDQDIDDIAVYYEAQTPSGLEADPGTWKNGEALYLAGDPEHGVPACVACHGPVGRGNLAAGYPALRAQQGAYVAKQLNDYAHGTRYNGNPATASRNGVMMLGIARQLTPEQIRDVAAYVQGMR